MVSRRSFLRGSFTPRPAAIRPPWSGDEHDFLSRCTRCGDCLSACPTRILRTGDGGYPEIDFRLGEGGRGGECTFCAACVTACQPQALATRDADGIRQPWRIRAHIADTCFTHHGIVCRTCGDHCDPRAISFQPLASASGGVARPQINLANCTGCGACLTPCPANAITIGLPQAA